jgi:type I site-specific restriction-modification system R (restriction) subunit
MFAVSSVDAAKLYYESFKTLQKDSDKPLRVATIFSFAANEEQDAIGDIQDESFDVSAMNSSAKEFLSAAIADYNALFKTNFSVDSNGFQNYYRDLAKQVKAKEIDLLIVVGMFLTGFDAPSLNTLFVDKNLRFHGLMQAYSRTNRIFDATKTFGNIVTFRDLEQATIDAITLFGDKNTKNVVLEKSYTEYMEGFTDAKGQLTELPLAIELKDFTIDEYPPKLMLIDNETGRALPEKSPVHLLLEEEVYGGTLQDWELTIQQSIPMAASVATEDTLKFTDFHSMGATYAVHLKAVNRKNRQTKEGWVSCGSFFV